MRVEGMAAREGMAASGSDAEGMVVSGRDDEGKGWWASGASSAAERHDYG